MEVETLNVFSLSTKTSACSSNIATSANYILLPSNANKKQARLCCLRQRYLVKELLGHTSDINYLCFGNTGTIFSTACKNIMNIWKIMSDEPQGESMKLRSWQLSKNLGIVTYMSFSTDDSSICVCIESEIWIICTKNNELMSTLSYCNEDFIAAEYCISNSQFVASISDNNTYEIWDLVEKQLIFKSSYLAVASPTCLCMHLLEQIVAIGFDDGMIRIFDMGLHNVVHQINLSSFTGTRDKEESTSSSVLSMKYFSPNNSAVDKKDDMIRCLLNERLLLAVACSTSVYVLNANSLDVLFTHTFADATCVPLISSASLVSFISCSSSELVFAAQHMLTKAIHLLKVTYTPVDESSNVALSVLSTNPLTANSPLSSILTPASKKVNAPVKKGKQTDKMNQPLTFKNNIKSSGYTKNKPRTQMFTPKTNQNKSSSLTSANKVGPWGLKQQPRVGADEYPLNAQPPTIFKQDKQVSHTNTSINQLRYTDSGKSLVAALAEEVALLMKPRSLDTITAFTGHNGSVNTAIMGHTNQIIITSGVDRTVKLWMAGCTDPILNLSHYRHNFQAGKIKNVSNKDNALFTKDIDSAMFYYNDQFILLSHGDSLCLYKFFLDQNKDELKRYQTNNRYKLVTDLQITDVQNITTFSAINSFYSYIVLCACSNRDLVIFDMNTSRQVHTIKDAHTRPVNSIFQNQGSSYVSQTPAAYDLFLTIAPTDAVKLWDLRVAKSVRRYEGHANRAHKVGLAYSPCSKYIAVGSEDRSVYVYDVRSSSYLHRLTGQSDVVSALSFHPQKPMLATASLTGLIKTYGI